MTNSLFIVSELLQVLQQTQPSDDVLQLAASTIVHLTSWTGVALFSPCEEGTMLCVSASAGQRVPQPSWRTSIEQGLIGDVWRSGELFHIPDLQAQPLPFIPSSVAACALLVPLKQGVPLLLFVVSDERQAFDENACLLAQSLGNVITMAVRNTRLYVALQTELTERQRIEGRFWATIRKTETLYRIGRFLNETAQFEQILQRVVNSVAAALHAEQVVLVSINGESEKVQHFFAGGPGAEQIVPFSYDEVTEGLMGQVISDCRPVFQPALAVDAVQFARGHSWYKGLESGSVAIVPLFSRRNTFGVLMVINRVGQPDFTQQDVELLMAIAAQVASAIQNALLFQAVAEERGRLQALVQSSRDGVILLGLNMHLLVINRPALNYLGLSGGLEDWLDQWFWEALSHLHKLSPQAVEAILEEVRRVQEGDDAAGEGEFQVGNRIVHWLNLPMLGDERAVGRLFVLRDVTEARSLERFREDLTHTMVHDLRNPLSGIYAGLRLLSKDSEKLFSPSQRQILEAAQLNTQRMLKLVGAILDINRLERGEMPLNLRPLNFSEIVRDVFVGQQPLAKQQSLHLRNEVALDIPRVKADRDLLDRVMQNVIGNALKFTPEGGTVSVSADVLPDMPDKLRVLVRDTGTGIPLEIRDHLFQKFVTGRQVQRGSGLGLAFCRMAMEAHGERIWVSETSDQGTTFAMTLPLVR